MVVTDDNIAFLSGFRNSALLSNVQRIMANELSLFKGSDELRPSSHRWSIENESLEALSSKLHEISDPFGRKIQLVASPARQILNLTPQISSALSVLQPIHIDKGTEVEKFNPYTGKWSMCRLNDEGGYRTVFLGRRYFYRNNSGQCFQGPHELIKILSARHAKVLLHGYDQINKNLECVLGCSPPGLYRRALVSLSGLLPEVDDWKLKYSSVDETSAKILMHKLYG